MADPKKALGILVIAGVTALAATVASVATADSTLDLNGAWQLDRKENFEEFLKQSGAPWWKRKLAQLGSSSMKQTIKHEGNRFEISSENPVETRTDMFVADGVSERSIETASGDMMTWTAGVEDAALVMKGHGDLGNRVVRREVIDDVLVMTIVNPDVDTRCKLFFKRAEAD